MSRFVLIRLVLLLAMSACKEPIPAGPTGLTITIHPALPVAGDPLEAVIVTEAVAQESGDPESATVVSYTYLWTRDGEVALTDATVPAGETARDEEWALTVTPFSAEGDAGLISGEPASAFVIIGDTAPVLDALALGPTDPTETSTLAVTLGSSHDIDGDAITFTYDWYVTDTLVRSGDHPTLTGADFSKGDVVYVTATPADDAATGASVVSNTATIADTAPTFDALALSPVPLYSDSVATCVPSGWSDVDDDPEAYRFVWYVEGDVAGTDATLDGSLFARGDEVSCQATAFDGDLEGPTLTTETTTVANAAPVLASASLSSLSPTTSDTVSLTLGTCYDGDGDYIVYQYEWFVNGVSAGSSSTLSPSHFSSGDTLWATVTPWDARDYGLPVMTDVATVQ